MKLYDYFRSSAAYRVRIALNLKGVVPDERTFVHLRMGNQRAQDYLALNPQGLVPALALDDGQVLTQSLAIIEYLDETHPEPPLLPPDALGRARVRALALDVACEIHPLNNLRVLRYLVRDLKVSEDDKNRWYRHWVETGLEVKAVGNSSDAIGGYAVPREIDEQIERTLVAISPIRAIANVVKVGTAGYRKLITTGGTPSGWVGFEAARPETNTPTFSEIVPANGELYANPAASQQMLDDGAFDVEAWLANEIATEFARAEGMAFVKGNGTNQPLGFISS